MAIQVRNTSQTIAVTTAEIAARREQRHLLVLGNDSDEVMYLAIDDDSVLNEGIRLGVGDTLVIDRNFYQDILNLPFTAISATGGKNMTITEIWLDEV